MRVRHGAAAAALSAAAALAVGTVVRASDHLDGPRVTADPQADITDVFAFTSPTDPSRVVLAMAVAPFASDAGTFAPEVDYAFRVRTAQALAPLTLDPTARDVVCSFDGGTPGHVTCAGPGGATATVTVGDESGGSGGSLKVFAGLRSDPAFFDRQGALATVTTGQARFTGHNAFAGANVLAIVVELPSALFAASADASAPVLAVAAETVRRSP